MMRRLFGAISLIGLMVIALPAGTAAASSAQHLTRIQSPRANQVVGANARVRVAVRSRESLAALRISVNGHNMTRLFRGSAGTYRATLSRGHGVRPGVNVLFVKTRNYKDFDRVSFILARRAPSLLTVTALDVDAPGAPARVKVRVADGATLRASLNGHRIDDAFQPQGRGYVGMLGANDGARPGRNRLVVRAYRTGHLGGSAVRDVARKTFRLRGVIAGAGRDLTIDAGESAELRGSAVGAGGDNLDYKWAIVDAPGGADDATLEQADTATPEFVAKTAGTYRIRTRVRAANGTASAVAAAGASSTDTVTITARANVPPMGWKLDTAAGDGTITLNGKPVAGTSCTDGGCPNIPFVSYAVFNRKSLELEASGNLYYDAAGLKAVTDLATKYDKAPTYLMVVNISRLYGAPAAVKPLLDKLGVADLSFPDALPLPVSIVGVPGSPKGSAMVSALYRGCQCFPAMDLSNMSGYVRLNDSSSGSGDFEFVRTDQVEFNTDASTTPGKIAMQVGAQTYTKDIPTDGSSGFFMVTLNSQTLAPLTQNLFVTNTPNGEEVPAATTGLYRALLGAASNENSSIARDESRGRVLVLLQGFGTPKGAKFGWQMAMPLIERIGGNPQVFARLNQDTPEEPDQGRYALVGRTAMGIPGAESSASLTGRRADGTLHGLLARGRDDQYLPLLADSAGSINFDLVNIVNRTPVAGGGFPAFETPGEAAAAQFLARVPKNPGPDHPIIMGICDYDAPTCDIRKSYYDKYDGVDWNTILVALGAKAKEACATAVKEGAAFSADECERARRKLETEVDLRNRVATYFGPNGLQGPFKGGVQIPALVNIAAISDEIQKAVQPPEAENTASRALNIISFAIKIAGAAGGLVNPGISTAANGVAAAFGLAAYLTHHDGTPDLMGPEVRAKALDLGSTLTTRYGDVSDYFATEAQIIMSDWTKLSQVAGLVASDKWKLDNKAATKSLNLATQQTIYQALIPVAYPVMYDLGTGINHAKDWICRSVPTFLYDKRLFQNTGTDAELPFIVPQNPALGEPIQIRMMAIGTRHTVDSLHSAYVPAPTQSLTDKLFRDPDAQPAGGIGLYKLQFYTQQNFRLFGKSLQQTKPSGLDWGYWTCQDMPDPPGNAG
jgi:hypothetical protein